MEQTVAPSAPPPTVADIKVEYAARRDQVLGPGNVPTGQLEELAKLLPLARVEVTHYRFVHTELLDGHQRAQRRRLSSAPVPAFPQGGTTVVTIRSGEIEIQGEANCSLGENFNRRLGIRIAFGRAMKALREQATSPIGLSGAERLPIEKPQPKPAPDGGRTFA